MVLIFLSSIFLSLLPSFLVPDDGCDKLSAFPTRAADFLARPQVPIPSFLAAGQLESPLVTPPVPRKQF